MVNQTKEQPRAAFHRVVKKSSNNQINDQLMKGKVNRRPMMHHQPQNSSLENIEEFVEGAKQAVVRSKPQYHAVADTIY